EAVQHPICNVIRGFNDRFGHALLEEKLTIAAPVEISDVTIDLCIVQPWLEVLCVHNCAKAHADTVLFFKQTGHELRLFIGNLAVEGRVLELLKNRSANCFSGQRSSG